MDSLEAENNMGRPKKQKDPATSSQNVETLQYNSPEKEEVMEQQKSILNELALGIAKTKDGWAVVEIAYNTDSGESDLQNVNLAGISRDDAIELFKITAVEKGLV